MRIVIDLQGAQTESRYRGIGRYTISFAKAVAKLADSHDVLIVLSGQFPETISTIKDEFSGILPEQNILVWYAPNVEAEEIVEERSFSQRAEIIRESFIAALRPDVVHLCSLFEGYVDKAITSIGILPTSTKVSVTLHDLIPLMNPKQYLEPNEKYSSFYLRKIEQLSLADAYLAISESSKRECIDYLNVKEAQVVNTSEGYDSSFRKKEIAEAERKALFSEFGVTSKYILYSGGADERKNLPRLIQAFSELPDSVKKNLQLVFAGKMPEGDVGFLKSLAHDQGLPDNSVIFTGYVSEETLINLYNLCFLFVFPSWHEGFGLPAIEAMACGAPVIGANTSSLPEVIGNEEALFNPFDVSSIARLIQKVCESPSFRESLIEKAGKHITKFSWEKSAGIALKHWEGLVDETVFNSRYLNWSEEVVFQKKMFNETLIKLNSISTLDNTPMIEIARDLEKNEKELSRYLRTYKMPERIHWQIEGPFDSSYSLALVNRETARALKKLGCVVSLYSTEGPGDYDPDMAYLNQHPDILQMYQASPKTGNRGPHVVSRNLYPPRVQDLNAQMNLLHGYAWEETGFPYAWVERFNTHLQGITVVSEHVKKVLIDNGVDIPISVVGNGVDHWLEISPVEKKIKAKSFKFLHVSSCFPRKGVDAMLKAYGSAFSDDDDVSLIIKTFENPHNNVRQLLADCKSVNPKYPDVVIIEDDYSPKVLKGLYQQCHALVAPSRAEGFGLPLAEAILSDLPVITTGWSGQLDFCNSDTAWLVDYEFEKAETHIGVGVSAWVSPKVDSLSKALLDVYSAKKITRDTKVNRAKTFLLDAYKWEDVASRTINSVRDWATPFNIEMNVGWISTWNTRCGIATYSEHLAGNMPVDLEVFAPKEEGLLKGDQNYVSRCWAIGEDDDLEELKETVLKKNITTLVIQFNYGFFNLEKLSVFMEEIADRNISIVIFLHSTNDPAHVPHKKLRNMVKGLSRCDRILVHSVADLNRLKNLALVDNVSLFPHGLLDYSGDQRIINPDKAKITSYGFFLPHKGLIELIESISILRKSGFDIELVMLNAEFPASESAEIIQEAKRCVDQLGLNSFVSICTDFLDDQDSLAHLADSDLVIFPYQDTGESASGAVKYGIASGTPVAVTPLDIFSDVKDAVYELPGQTSEEMAKGIKEILINIYSKSDVSINKAQKASSWRQENLYSTLGKRLFGMMLGLIRSKLNSFVD